MRKGRPRTESPVDVVLEVQSPKPEYRPSLKILRMCQVDLEDTANNRAEPPTHTFDNHIEEKMRDKWK